MKTNGSGDRVAIPSHDDVAARAYEIYLRRPAGERNAVEDWLQAERELADKRADAAVPAASLKRPRGVRHAIEHDLVGK